MTSVAVLPRMRPGNDSCFYSAGLVVVPFSLNPRSSLSILTILFQGFGALCDNLETEAELQVLLGMLPESKGGLGSLALGLLSTSTRCAKDNKSA